MMHRSLGGSDLTSSIILERLWNVSNSVGRHHETARQRDGESNNGRLVPAVPLGVPLRKFYCARCRPDYEYRSKYKPLGGNQGRRNNQCEDRDRSHCRSKTLHFNRRLVQRFSYEPRTAAAFIRFSKDRAAATRTKH